MELLSNDLIFTVLRWLDDFSDVLTFVAYKRAYVLLQPSEYTSDFIIQPQHTSEQLSALRYLQVRYHLPRIAAVTFSKLVWQYKHATRDCTFNRLKYAAKCKPDIDHAQVHTLSEEDLGTLTIIAYNANNLPLANDLWTVLMDHQSAGTGIATDVTNAAVKAEIRRILQPHKLMSDREIRQKNFDTLYSLEVSDDVKREIWVQKYGDYKYDQEVDHSEPIMECATAYCKALAGTLNELVYGEDDEPLPFIWQAACETANFELMDKILEYDTYPVRTFKGICILIARGYWETLAKLLTSDHRLITPLREFLLDYLKDMNVTQILDLLTNLRQVLVRLNGNPCVDNLWNVVTALSAHKGLLITSIVTDNYRLTAEILQTESLDVLLWDERDRTKFWLRCLKRSEKSETFHIIFGFIELKPEHQGGTLSKLFNKRSLWLSIWQEHGKAQFEASLTYVRTIHGVDIDVNKLLTRIAHKDLSLSEYLLGWVYVDHDIQEYTGQRLLQCDKALDFDNFITDDDSDINAYYRMVREKYA